MQPEKKRPARGAAQQPPKSARRRNAASAPEPAPHSADELARYRNKRDFSTTPEPRRHVRNAHTDRPIQEPDAEARGDEEPETTAGEPHSVASGRSLEEIGGPDEAMWTSNRESGSAQPEAAPV